MDNAVRKNKVQFAMAWDRHYTRCCPSCPLQNKAKMKRTVLSLAVLALVVLVSAEEPAKKEGSANPAATPAPATAPAAGTATNPPAAQAGATAKPPVVGADPKLPNNNKPEFKKKYSSMTPEERKAERESRKTDRYRHSSVVWTLASSISHLSLTVRAS
jgi:hypothetical protein